MFKNFMKGCGYVPGYGHHPGTGFLVFLLVAGAVVGSERGSLLSTAVGFGAVLIVFGPIYVLGAISRGKMKK